MRIEPTDRVSTMIETHVLRLEGGRIVESQVRANNFGIELLLAPALLHCKPPARGEDQKSTRNAAISSLPTAMSVVPKRFVVCLNVPFPASCRPA